LFCQTTITQNGEPIVGTVGTTELQVNERPRTVLRRRQSCQTATPPPAQSRIPTRTASRQGAQKDGKKP